MECPFDIRCHGPSTASGRCDSRSMCHWYMQSIRGTFIGICGIAEHGTQSARVASPDSNSELKIRAMGYVGTYPYSSPVRFPNRPADGQPHTHPRSLRRIKTLEQALDVFRSHTRPRIQRGDIYVTCVVLAGTDGK